MRQIKFQNEYFYHIYNRGVDKREVFGGVEDYLRFLRSMRDLNQLNPIGSLFLKDYLDNKTLKEPDSSSVEESGSLVKIIAYCLLPNHFHLLLEQVQDQGISKLMQKLGISHTNYFNAKYNRSGYLFQSRFKAVPIKTDEQLLYVSAYINGNPEIHKIAKADKWPYSSYQNYLGKRSGSLVNIKVILKEFENSHDYQKYVNEVIKNSSEIKEEIKKCLLE